MPRISPSLIHLVASALLALILALGPMRAEGQSAAPGGSVLDCPAP